ncbi:Plasmodium exported protein, unknown function, partial [Plasmodium vivax]
TFNKVLEYKYEKGIRLNVKFNRLLARHEHERGLERKSLREKLPDRIPYKEKRNVSDNITAFSHVKKIGSNNIEQYMNNYKHRHGKKKGLSKLDCYYENKVFGKFNHICDIAKNMQYDKKRSKKFLYRKYGIGLFLFALLPAIGLIFPILFGWGDNPGVWGICIKDHFSNLQTFKHKDTGDKYTQCTSQWLYKHKDVINIMGCVNTAFSCIMVTIVLLVFIYIIAKVVKYERIKSGKRKMKRREYINYCKEVFNL